MTTAAAVTGLLAAAFLAVPAAVMAAATPAAKDSSILVIAGPKEPGTRLIVTGRVLSLNGMPAPGERVFIYHTDASGDYGVHPSRRSLPPARDARLSGWLVTDAEGRFEIRTVRPGLYPGGGTPAHMHFVVGGGHPWRGHYEMRFKDDPTLRDPQWARQSEGSTMQIRPVATDAKGVQHVTVEWLKP